MDSQSTNGILEDFRIEFLDCWHRLPNKGFFLMLLGAWLVLFHYLGNSTFGYINDHSLLGWMFFIYRAKGVGGEVDEALGNFIPFVVLGLFWWKRKELLDSKLRLWWPALMIFAFGLLVHIVGFMVQQPRVSIIGMFIGIYGLTGVAWGPEWLRKSFFPFFLFAFMVPLGTVAIPITFRLRMWVTQIVEGICGNLLSLDIIREGATLRDPSNSFQYEVAAACSGIRSLVATFAFSIVYAWITFGSWWKRGVLVAASFPLAILGNVTRMLFIIFASEFGILAKHLGMNVQPQDWGNWVHANWFFSLIPYLPAFAGLMLIAHWLRDRGHSPGAPNAAVELEAKAV